MHEIRHPMGLRHPVVACSLAVGDATVTFATVHQTNRQNMTQYEKKKIYIYIYDAIWKKKYIYIWRNMHIFNMTQLWRIFCLLVWCTVAKVTASPTAREHATTGWRRPIGCLISRITFLKRATNYRALLRKMACKDKASYESSPPSTLSDLCQDWFVSLIWRVQMCDMAHWHVAFILISWVIHMCDIAHSYVGHDSFMCHVPRRTCAIHFGDDHICDISHPYVWNDLFALICVT